VQDLRGSAVPLNGSPTASNEDRPEREPVEYGLAGCEKRPQVWQQEAGDRALHFAGAAVR
jgi:hypothetical protein